MKVLSLSSYRASFGPTGSALSLATFASIHETSRVVSGTPEGPSKWEWEKSRTVEKTQEILWHMTGDWKARRAVTIERPALFFARVTKEVTALARLFNTHRVFCLQDLVRTPAKLRIRIIRRILSSVQEISRARKTKLVQPVLGSKVLHHYFPGVIPVFDDLLIAKRVLRAKHYRDVARTAEYARDMDDAGELAARTDEFASYLFYCMHIISSTDTGTLNRVRRALGDDSKMVFPHEIATGGKSHLLWKLDAKLVEYCLIARS
jgi:hypothetical protein